LRLGMIWQPHRVNDERSEGEAAENISNHAHLTTFRA